MSADPPPLEVEMGVAAEPRSVAEVRDAVSRFATGVGWIGERRVDDLKLLVSEIVTNAIAAHRSASVTQQVEIRCRRDADRFELTVIDHGGGFDAPEGPVEPAEPDLNRVSGFGLALISTLADETRFARTSDGTEVSIVLVRRQPSS